MVMLIINQSFLELDDGFSSKGMLFTLLFPLDSQKVVTRIQLSNDNKDIPILPT